MRGGGSHRHGRGENGSVPSACGPRERTSPHHLYTPTDSPNHRHDGLLHSNHRCLGDPLLSNRQVTPAGHTLTALTLQHPHLLLSLQTGLSSLEERIPHLSERFCEHPTFPPHTNVIKYSHFKIYATINPNLLPVCALKCPKRRAM